MHKEELKELKCLEDDGNLAGLIASEVGKVHILNNCITFIMAKWNFTSEASKLRHKNINLEYWENFIRHANSTILLESSGDMPPNPLPGLVSSSGSSSNKLTQVEYFNRSIKHYSSNFNFKEWKNWETWHRNSLTTTRAQDADNILDSYCIPLTQEEANLFNEK